MTFEVFARKYLVDNGLRPDEADAVIVAAKANDDLRRANFRWSDPAEEVPALRAVFTLTLNDIATEWIDANKPLHWARPMFATNCEHGSDGAKGKAPVALVQGQLLHLLDMGVGDVNSVDMRLAQDECTRLVGEVKS